MTDKKEPSAKVEKLRPKRPCPICSTPSAREFFPFCSKRCADIDLNRWLKGAYTIPVVEEDEFSEGGSGTDE